MKDKRKIKTTCIKIKATKVPATTYYRNGKKIVRKAYTRKAHTRCFKEIVNEKIGFMELAKKVAKQVEGQPIPKKYQKEYEGHKRYTKEDALKYGKKVAQKVRMQIFAKKGQSLRKTAQCGCIIK